MRQADELWWAPEMERRNRMSTIDDNFTISMAQALFLPNGSVVVRFNHEVRGIANVRASRRIEKGGHVYQSDLDGPESFDLLDEDLDCGHFTMINGTNGWFLTFNFLRSRSLCAKLLGSAKEFSDVAQFSMRHGKSRPAVDTLYSACELVSKAQLILSSMLDWTAKSHRAIQSEINKWRCHGNINANFVDLFNKLGELRPSCRYEGASIEHALLSQKEFALVEAEITRIEQLCLQLPPGEIGESGPEAQQGQNQ